MMHATYDNNDIYDMYHVYKNIVFRYQYMTQL